MNVMNVRNAPNPVHFIVFGSTGPAGLRTVELALTRKHQLTLYVRSPDKLPNEILANPLVTVVKGELNDKIALDACFSAATAKDKLPVHGIISVLGPKTGQPKGNPLTKGYEVILRLMKQYGIERMVLLSTVSVQSPKDHFSTIRETLVAGIKLVGYTAWQDVVAIGELMRSPAAEGLKITLARVPTLNDGAGGTLKVGFVADGVVGWLLARIDLAVFFVGEGEEGKWAGEAPLISS